MTKIRKTSGTVGQREARYAALTLAAACMVCGVHGTEIAGKGRGERVVLARRVIVFVLRRDTALSFPEIRDAMGKSVSHTSVIYLFDRAWDLHTAGNEAFARAVQQTRDLVDRHPEQVEEAIRKWVEAEAAGM